MPSGTIFVCSACGTECQLGGGFLDYAPQDGERIPLIHPGEREQLKGLGVAYDDALRDGTLWVRGLWGCRACGRIFEHRHRAIPRMCRDASWVFLAAFLATFTLMCIGNLWSPSTSMNEWAWFAWRTLASACVWGIAASAWIVMRRVDLKRTARAYAERIEPLCPSACVYCGSADVFDTNTTNDDGETSPLACSMCGKQSLKVRGAWMA